MKSEGLHHYLDRIHRYESGVKNDMQANRVVQKIDQLKEKRKMHNLVTRSELDRIEKWRDEVNDELNEQISQYSRLIYEYMAQVRKKNQNPSLNQLKLPYATVTFLPKTSTWHYDEERLINFFLQTNQLQFLRIELNKQEMRNYFREGKRFIYDPETGNVLKGVTVESNGEYFRIKRNQ